MYSAQDQSGKTATILAKSKNTDLNLRDNNGNTAIMLAAKEKNQKAVLVLLKENADLWAVNKDNQTVFELADEYLAGTPAASVLNIRKQEVDGQNILGQKAAEIAALEEQLAQQEVAVKALEEQASSGPDAVREQLREQVEQELGISETDEEIAKLQRQLEAAKAQKEAAINEAVEEKLAETQDKLEPSVLADEAQELQQTAQDTVEVTAADIAAEIQAAEAEAAAQQAKARKAARTKAAKAKAKAAEKVQAVQQQAQAVGQNVNQAVEDQAAAVQNAYTQTADFANDQMTAAQNAYNQVAGSAQDAINAAASYDPYAPVPYDQAAQGQM